ncbi:exodeoxyribonuclease V subunit gamma [Actinoplanes sp. Pm04-4]|uniref:Exodeoxyribonuclease V subunit gamma n=1 Tax=Paractinoplanes pyxinae TaxID=2997416 RepID=A0ABT4AQ68_9ACTN|nr:exodeoxyribonuclease V subunit gamma [Actinoplanes pyxinae]MCY1136381.1 exodeoxyribonuclease V subunit gamma [Actinoplanes pyxinae]
MLLIHRAGRTDRLAGVLADLVAEPLGDPFAAEVVSVLSKGVERWLAEQLSLRLGVCANVRFPSMADLLEQVGMPGAVEDPWRPDRRVWPLLDAIDSSLGEPWCATLAAYLETPGRRYATARRLAELFDSYGQHRPAMLRAWAAGDDSDGVRGGLTDDLCWQAELWRRVRARMVVPSAAERLPGICEGPASGARPGAFAG